MRPATKMTCCAAHLAITKVSAAGGGLRRPLLPITPALPLTRAVQERGLVRSCTVRRHLLPRIHCLASVRLDLSELHSITTDAQGKAVVTEPPPGTPPVSRGRVLRKGGAALGGGGWLGLY